MQVTTCPQQKEVLPDPGALSAGVPCSKRPSVDGGSGNGGTPEPACQKQKTRHQDHVGLPSRQFTKTLYLSSSNIQYCHYRRCRSAKHTRARSTEHLVSAGACLYVLLGGLSAHLGCCLTATYEWSHSRLHSVLSLSISGDAMTIFWSFQLGRASESNIVGDAVMATPGKDGSNRDVGGRMRNRMDCIPPCIDPERGTEPEVGLTTLYETSLRTLHRQSPESKARAYTEYYYCSSTMRHQFLAAQPEY